MPTDDLTDKLRAIYDETRGEGAYDEMLSSLILVPGRDHSPMFEVLPERPVPLHRRPFPSDHGAKPFVFRARIWFYQAKPWTVVSQFGGGNRLDRFATWHEAIKWALR